jgi:hypothetical protein
VIKDGPALAEVSYNYFRIDSKLILCKNKILEFPIALLLLCPFFTNFRGNLSHFLLVPGDEDDVEASPRQLLGVGLADAIAASGDDCTQKTKHANHALKKILCRRLYHTCPLSEFKG